MQGRSFLRDFERHRDNFVDSFACNLRRQAMRNDSKSIITAKENQSPRDLGEYTLESGGMQKDGLIGQLWRRAAFTSSI